MYPAIEPSIHLSAKPPKPTFVGVISLILYSSLSDFSHHWSITTWNPIGFIHPNRRWWVLEWSYNKIAVCLPYSPLVFFHESSHGNSYQMQHPVHVFQNLSVPWTKSWSYQKWTYHSGQFVTTKLPPVGHPKWSWKVRECHPKWPKDSS